MKGMEGAGEDEEGRGEDDNEMNKKHFFLASKSFFDVYFLLLCVFGAFDDGAFWLEVS